MAKAKSTKGKVERKVNKLKFKVVMLKISGEGLAGKNGCFDGETFRKLARRVKRLRDMGVMVIIVVGGGNILRGSQMKDLNPDNLKEVAEAGHKAGMLATCINSILLANQLEVLGVPVYLTSARKTFGMPKVFESAPVQEALRSGKVVVHGGGMGVTGISTDTATVKLGYDAQVDIVAMAKNGTDGIYAEDPKKNPNAQFFKEISASEFLERGLKQVIDSVAVEFARDKGLTLAVFNSENDTAVEEIVQGKQVGSLVLPK